MKTVAAEMSIGRLCDKLRKQLFDIEYRLVNLRVDIDSAAAGAGPGLRAKLENARAQMEARQDEAELMHGRIAAILQVRRMQTEAAVEAWIRDRDVENMEVRAQVDEDYASEKVSLAMIAIEEAELALLEAFAARAQADWLAGCFQCRRVSEGDSPNSDR